MRAPIGVSLVILAAAGAALHAAPAGVRSVFLNGVDISSAKSQDLKNVDIHINENGDVFIIAPHYQVNEEDTYVPLSKYVQGLNQPQHKAPDKMGGGPGMPLTKMNDAPIPKAGEPVSPPAASQQLPLAAKPDQDGNTPTPVSALPQSKEGMKGGDPPPPALPGDEPPKSEPPAGAQPVGAQPEAG